jgi:hypothetical protein
MPLRNLLRLLLLGIISMPVGVTRKDLQGVETGALYGASGDQRGLFINAGHDGGLWDGFFTLSGRRGRQDTRPYSIVRFTGPDGMPVPPQDRLGCGKPEDAQYFDTYGHIAHGGWFNLSGRLAFNEKPYTMISNDGATRWGESRSTPFGFVKVEAKRDLDWSSALKFTGYYAYLANAHEVIDRTLNQKENTAYAEIVYDRSVMQGTGKITGGLSYRRREIDNAPIWTGYLPGYLASQNPAFMPIVLEKDFDSRLWSLFGQVMKTIGNVDLFAGVRHDMHNDLADQTSVNAGIGWSPHAAWRYKLQYGTAYRTPFARQLYTSSDPDFEEIRSLNLQVAWQPALMRASITGFHQRIDNHVMEDPYAGLSRPNCQDIYGIELDGSIRPHRTLTLQTGRTWLTNNGPDENYRYLESVTIDPDGTVRENYAVNTYPYDPGADLLFNFQATWRPLKRFSLNTRALYVSSRYLDLARQDKFQRVRIPGFWRFDASAVLQDLFVRGADLEISFYNLTDNRYTTAGTYDVMTADSFSAQALFRIRW